MMRKLFLTLMLIVNIIAFSSYAQSGALLSLKKTVHDFGTIKEDDGKVTITFDFVNAGKSPLIVQRVVSSCDCAAVEWTKEPLTPGANGSVSVVYNPKDRPGKFEKLITIYSNADVPSSVLTIKGFVQEHTKTIEEIYNRVLGDFRFKNTHAAFGRVLNNEVKVDTIEFISAAKEPVKIGSKIVGLPHLNVKFVPETLKPQEKGLMIITFDAKIRNDWGFVIDRFSLTQNDKDINGAVINVSASIEENFTSLTDAQRANAPKIDFANPNYDFGAIEEGRLIEKDFSFTNTGKTDLIIRKIKASCGCTTVEPADKLIKPGKTSSFKASIKSNGFSGRIAKTVTVITNDPVNSSVVVRITGTVNPLKK